MPSVRKQRGGKKVAKPISLADSPALRRLIEEVRVEREGGEPKPGGGYNRTYHRHNR